MRGVVVSPGPHFSVMDVHRGVIAGLEANGVNTHQVNFDDHLDFYTAAHIPDSETGELRKAFPNLQDAARIATVSALEPILYQFWPHVVIVISGFFVDPQKYALIRNRGHKLILWCTESPYEDERQAWMAGNADLVVVNDPTNLDMFRAVNKNTHYVPHAYQPNIHRPDGNRMESDCFFVGTGYPSRVEWLEKVDWTGVDFALAGNWSTLRDDSPLHDYVIHDVAHCLNNSDTVDWYRGTKASFNLYRREAMRLEDSEGWAVGPREIELAACETFFFRDPRGESDELFPMLPTLTTPGEFSEQLRWWLAHDNERRDAARLARAAIAERTFTNTVAEVLRLADSTS